MWEAAPVSGLVSDSKNELPEVLCVPTRKADCWERQRQGWKGRCAWWAPPAARWRQAGGGSNAGAGAATGH